MEQEGELKSILLAIVSFYEIHRFKIFVKTISPKSHHKSPFLAIKAFNDRLDASLVQWVVLNNNLLLGEIREINLLLKKTQNSLYSLP
jgi:hypothetical protein